MEEKYGTIWTKEETTLALFLYCQIPFARTKRTEPTVQRLASIIGRTPSAVARKLGNLGAFDERLTAQGISGLSHTSHLDREVWDHYNEKWEELVVESNEILARLKKGDPFAEDEEQSLPTKFSGVTDREATVRVRRGQRFFRRAVLASYGGSCAFCGFDLPELVIAGHIIPWAVREDLRVEPRNGLALCAIHDRAYDRGYVTVDSDLRLKLSPRLHSYQSQAVDSMLRVLEGRLLLLPSRFLPEPEYLLWHLESVFR